MEKISSAPGSLGFGSLFAYTKKKKDRLLNRFLPGWTTSKIEEKLLIPKTHDGKTIRVPREFKQSRLNTKDGTVQVYQTGNGPTVIFNHGWGGGAHQFFPLMRGLAQCGFRSVAFDHLGHGLSDAKPATLQQSIATTNFLINKIKTSPNDGLAAIVGHSTGCIAIANAHQGLIRDVPLFLISPVFNFKLFFLKKLVQLRIDGELIKQYATHFSKTYRRDYLKHELARNLNKYADVAVIAHDELDNESAVTDSVKFCHRYPLTRLLVTKNHDHQRIINSESVWQELKSTLNYDDTTINFTAEVIYM